MQIGFAPRASTLILHVIMKTLVIIALCLASAGTASANDPFGWLIAPFRNMMGSQFRQVNPWGYQGALAASRSIPPQVRNSWGNNYRVMTPYQAELNYWRSMPPEVRNNIARQQQQWQQQQNAARYYNPPVNVVPQCSPNPLPFFRR